MKKEPLCPYCYQGKIEYHKNHDVYVCDKCFREVKIKVNKEGKVK